MGTYIYKVKDEKGRKYLGVSEAEDEKTLKKNLREHGWYAFKIRPFREGRKGSLFGGRVNLDSLIMFTHQLASMLEAGIPILNILDIMWKQTDDAKFQIVISQMRNRLSQGKSLSEAFDEFSEIFPPIYCALIKVAETSGSFVKVLRKLLEYLTGQKELLFKIKKAVTYPVIVICFAVFIVILMLLWVVPIFQEVFVRVRVDLPIFTKVVINISLLFRSLYFWALAAVVSSTLFFVYKRFSAASAGRETIDRLKLKIPILGKMLYTDSVARFSRSLGLLLDSGLPITQGMELAKITTLNTKLLRSLDWVEDRIVEGASLHTSLDATRIFPSFLIEMVAVGEESGTLVEMLERVAIHFEEELDYRLNRFLSYLEPFLIIFIGAMVVFIMLSIYLPIFKLWGGIAGI